MKYMVEYELKPGSKNKLFDAFELRGPNRTPGVKFLGAWMGKHSDVVFILVEAESEARLNEAAQSWGDIGERRVTSVTDVETY